MRIKVAFEIGHSSYMKSKATPDGFTHDWELSVRGSDGSNISKFVEKVVFNLHESFPRPTRVYKDPPYVLKESGYASFNLPIDIYYRAGARDEPKKVSILYDLDIYKTTSQRYPFFINNPSSEFRHKLLEGGGIMINTDGQGNIEERVYSQPDSTTKPRPHSSGGGSGTGGVGGGSSSSSGGKKHKIKSEDVKPTSTFETLFGSPILNSKSSPDSKTSNNISNNKLSISSSKIPSQKSSSKERSTEKSKEKREKKEKSGSIPKISGKETIAAIVTGGAVAKKSEKHERREEKRKEKSSTKERERSKDKVPKVRPPSPKPPSRSPKRSTSPPRDSSSNSNRHEIIQVKHEDKSSSSSGKKSKKEKRDKSKDHDRSSSEKHKDGKHHSHKKEEKSSSKTMDKLNGANDRKEPELKDPHRDKSNKYRMFDIKPPSPIADIPIKHLPAEPVEVKKEKSREKEERKHKHKKKDKNKDKEKSKKSKSKHLPEDSVLSTTTPIATAMVAATSMATVTSNRKHTNVPIPAPTNYPNRILNAKSHTQPAPQPELSQLSSASESDDDDYVDRTSLKADKVTSSNDTNQSMDHLIDPIPPEPVSSRSIQNVSPKKHKDKSSSKKSKESKSKEQSVTPKDEKKRKRKSKSEKPSKHDSSTASSSNKRKTVSPLANEAPPTKLLKRETEKIPKIKEEFVQQPMTTNRTLPGRTPPVPVQRFTASPSSSQQRMFYQHQSPDSSKHANRKRAATTPLNYPTAKMAHISPQTSSTSESSSDSSSPPSPTQRPRTIPRTRPAEQSPQPPPPLNDKVYVAQLRALQRKINNIQDNDELQQVVDIIAATGRFEINTRTFDFDLCTLDRRTIQRLQAFLG